MLLVLSGRWWYGGRARAPGGLNKWYRSIFFLGECEMCVSDELVRVVAGLLCPVPSGRKGWCIPSHDNKASFIDRQL